MRCFIVIQCLALLWALLSSCNGAGQGPGRSRLSCWDRTCEFTLTLQFGHSMIRFNDVGKEDKLDLSSGGCVKPTEDPSSECLTLPDASEVASSVITGDGRYRKLLLVNGLFPGPTLEVEEGATVIIHVRNRMPNVGASIHWHGFFQTGTPWMDGPAYISQCPILPSSDFTYKFQATPAGTKFYHPHLSNMRSDGQYGMFIVHKKRPTIPELPLFIVDWNEVGGLGERVMHVDMPRAVSSLINGRGRNMNQAPEAPLSKFQVQAGQKYRFRTVNAGMDLGYAVSVDGHKMTIVAWDGTEIDPIEVDIFNIYGGERIDFEITVSSRSSAYWLRVAALPQLDSNPTDVKAEIYIGERQGEPVSEETSCTSSNKCKLFNCYRNLPTSANKICVQLQDVKTASLAEVSPYLRKPDTELLYNIAVTTGDGFNGRRFSEPLSPFYDKQPQNLTSCQKHECYSTTRACWCTHGKRINEGDLVTLVISNLESDPNVHEDRAGHPMHLHGHSFAVLAIGLAEWNPDNGNFISDIKSISCEPLCTKPKWNPSYPVDLVTDRPPVKDTVILPVGGYVVLRFIANNPGYWLLHCHMLRDQMEGMIMYFEVAPEKLDPPKPQTPPCSPSFTLASWGTPEKTDDDSNGGGDSGSDLGNGSDDDHGNNPNPSPKSEKLLTPIELMGVIVGTFAVGVIVTVVIALCCKTSRRGTKS